MIEGALITAGASVAALVAAYWILVALAARNVRRLKDQMELTAGLIGEAQCATISFEQLEAHAKRLAAELRTSKGVPHE